MKQEQINKPFSIPKQTVYAAWKEVKKGNRGSAGIDKVSIEEYQQSTGKNLYKLWNGEIIERTEGVPQGSVIGPGLANLFMHYVFDKWMQIHYPHIPFERYADDTICHCRTKAEAEQMQTVISQRITSCKLSLNTDKNGSLSTRLDKLLRKIFTKRVEIHASSIKSCHSTLGEKEVQTLQRQCKAHVAMVNKKL